MARFIREIRTKSGTYYALVESSRRRRRVVQKYLKSFGKNPPPTNYQRWLMPIDDRRKVPFRIVIELAGEYEVSDALAWPFTLEYKHKKCPTCGESRTFRERIPNNDFDCHEWLAKELRQWLRYYDFDDVWLVKAYSWPSAIRRVQRGERVNLLALMIIDRMRGL